MNPVTRVTHAALLPGADWVTPPWLTSRDHALLAVKPFGGRAQLRELDALGLARMECALDLPLVRRPASLPVVTNGQYAMLTQDGTGVALEVWTVPGLAPATRGWVSPLGGPGFDWREQ